MAQILSFTLENFKGVEHVKIDLQDRVSCPVLTLIGLNESGKTTILEGLSHFVSGDKSVSDLFEGVHLKTSGTGLIPVHKKAAFTGTIKVSALIELTPEELEHAQEIAKKAKLIIDQSLLSQKFELSKSFKFEDSELQKTNIYWNFNLSVKKSKNAKFKQYERPKDKDAPDLWLELVRFFEKKLPQISYFPTFLVDMPNRIYLSEHDGETAVNRHYRYVFQDILNSLEGNLSLEKHVCNRITEFKQSQKSPNWFSIFFSSDLKTPVDSVFQKISHAVTMEVLGSWQRVFQRAISAKNILIEWNIDAEKSDLPYASFHVTDGESRYAISERSLGFRWFFSFLLFTAFKQGKERSTFFIFDEPAANLHAKAQAELLTSFSKIASEGNRVIYSTHSHHMINPNWLSGAYIVENTAVDYDVEDSFGLNAKPTNIKITKYRDFVSKFPTRSSYFQPVIEKLEYATPEIIGKAPFVIVEGVSDYYALTLAIKLLKLTTSFRLIPGVGSGASDPVISLLLGRGEEFSVLLDDDAAGLKEADRYREKWFLDEDSIFTLHKVSPDFKEKQIEGFLTSESLTRISKHLEQSKLPTKKQIGWYLAEMCAVEHPQDALCPETLKNLEKIIKFLELRHKKSD